MNAILAILLVIAGGAVARWAINKCKQHPYS